MKKKLRMRKKIPRAETKSKEADKGKAGENVRKVTRVRRREEGGASQGHD